MIGFPTFVVVDVDAKVPLDERHAYAKAQQRQIHFDYATHWGRTGSVRVATPDSPPRANEIEVRLINKPTMSGAVGYHDCKPDGTPIAYVFVGLARDLGMKWTTVASHEVLEIMGDPLLRNAIEMTDGFWDCEVCDRVEQEEYTVLGVALSNFNYPEAFQPPQELTGVKFDAMGTSTKPNEVRPGGYAQKFDPKKGWVQVGQMSAYRKTLSDMGLSRGARRRKRYHVKGTWVTRLFARWFTRQLNA